MKKILISFFLLIPLSLQAHSGRLNSLGCHNDNIHGGYHCHLNGDFSKNYTEDEVLKIQSNKEEKTTKNSRTKNWGSIYAENKKVHNQWRKNQKDKTLKRKQRLLSSRRNKVNKRKIYKRNSFKSKRGIHKLKKSNFSSSRKKHIRRNNSKFSLSQRLKYKRSLRKTRNKRNYSKKVKKAEIKALVSRVIDGDTIEVLIENEKKKVRILGIDTPETKHPQKPVECMGKEASSYLKNLIEDKDVSLIFEGPLKDRYGRILAFVDLNGVDVGAEMIKSGYSNLYTKKPNSRMNNYRKLLKDARESEKGLWNKNSCIDF